VAVEGVCKLLHLGLFALDGQDRGAVDEAFVLLTTLFARWSGARHGDDESEPVVVEEDLDNTEDDEFMKMTVAAAATASDEGVEPRARALQVLAVFFAAAERNAQLCVVAARNVYRDSAPRVLRRTQESAGERGGERGGDERAAADRTRAERARLACTRLLLCEILANVSGPERAHVKFLSLLPPRRATTCSS
jgi:hypothetical protein